MKHGLIIGKFMPPHKGHLALINFGLSHCDHLTVLVCALPHEPIPGYLRYRWIRESFNDKSNIFIDYTNKELPQNNLSLKEISKVWAAYLKSHYPETNIIFSSETYGAYLAEFMNHIEFKNFDINRNYIKISGSAIRKNPYTHWEHIAPAAKEFFTKKIVISGPKNKEKTALTKKLAEKFQTQFVTDETNMQSGVNENLIMIAKYNALEIIKKLKNANRILFIDTDLINLKLWAKQHYHRIPLFDRKIQKINKYDLTLLYKNDSKNELTNQIKLYNLFLNQLKKENRKYIILDGTWDEKLNSAIETLLKKWPWLKNQLLQ